MAGITLKPKQTQPTVAHVTAIQEKLLQKAASPTWAGLRFLVPLGTSVLLWMSFFPLAWGFLTWVALVPLLCLVRRDCTGKRAFWLAYLAGAAFFWPTLQWMRVADYRMA